MPICISEPGLGKSLIMSAASRVVGLNNFSNGKILDVTGLGRSGTQWGDWIYDKKISCIEEISPDGEGDIRYKVLDALKDIITNDTLPLNLKGGRNGTFHVYSNIIGYSNHVDCIKIPPGDRRIFVIDSSGQKKLSQSEYEKFISWMDDDKNITALFQHLLYHEISDEFEPGKAKMTSDKVQMQLDGKSDAQVAFDIIIEHYPCDLITPSELKLAFEQAMAFINDEDVTIYTGVAATNKQFFHLTKSMTKLTAGSRKIRFSRTDGEKYNDRIRSLRNFDKWKDCSDEKIKDEMRKKIPLFWLPNSDNTQNYSAFSGQF
jgi:hypothetical protein